MPALARALLLIALAVPVAVTGAHGQTAQPELRVGPGGQAPYVPSWDRALRRFYEREKLLVQPDPYAKSDRALRRLYDDPIRRLGLPENRLPRIGPGTLPSAAPLPLPAEIVALDTDGDGLVTKREYVEHRFRHRPVTAGPAVEVRRRSYQDRVGSRFEGADRDRDGRLTADELRGVVDPRF